jgi:hypothetical protein
MRPAPSARTGLKAAAVSAGAVLLLSSGVAFAATGHAPWQAADTTVGARTTGTSVTSSDEGTATTGPAAHAFPGLCRAYLSGNKAVHGRALQSRAFAALVTAADGVDNLPTFCASVTAAPQAHRANPAHPAHPAHPVHPTHPAGGSSTDPSEATDPSHPAHPTHPTHPTKPTHPTHPTKPTHPTHPPKPTHPTHATQGAEPTHPVHPTHPPHPTHT